MTAVLRRELSSFFHSPVGYVFLAVFYIFAGIYFLYGSIVQDSASLTPVFSSMFSITLFLVPILTMRLFSEERKNKTDQALLTAPVSLTGIVLGKYLAAVVVFLLGHLITLVFALVVAAYAPPDWGVILGNFTALLLLGMALTAIGMFFSSITENQVIAACLGFGTGLFLLLIDALRSLMTNPVLTAIIGAFSFYDRYADFTAGIFDLSAAVYFLSVCFLFVFLTVRVFEKRRWA